MAYFNKYTIIRKASVYLLLGSNQMWAQCIKVEMLMTQVANCFPVSSTVACGTRF